MWRIQCKWQEKNKNIVNLVVSSLAKTEVKRFAVEHIFSSDNLLSHTNAINVLEIKLETKKTDVRLTELNYSEKFSPQVVAYRISFTNECQEIGFGVVGGPNRRSIYYFYYFETNQMSFTSHYCYYWCFGCYFFGSFLGKRQDSMNGENRITKNNTTMLRSSFYILHLPQMSHTCLNNDKNIGAVSLRLLTIHSDTHPTYVRP